MYIAVLTLYTELNLIESDFVVPKSVEHCLEVIKEDGISKAFEYHRKLPEGIDISYIQYKSDS
jgi:hypothetical protein